MSFMRTVTVTTARPVAIYAQYAEPSRITVPPQPRVNSPSRRIVTAMLGTITSDVINLQKLDRGFAAAFANRTTVGCKRRVTIAFMTLLPHSLISSCALTAAFQTRPCRFSAHCTETRSYSSFPLVFLDNPLRLANYLRTVVTIPLLRWLTTTGTLFCFSAVASSSFVRIPLQLSVLIAATLTATFTGFRWYIAALDAKTIRYQPLNSFSLINCQPTCRLPHDSTS